MSLITNAVKKASQEKEQLGRSASLVDSALSPLNDKAGSAVARRKTPSFLFALVVFCAMTFVASGLYFYQAGKIDQLRQQILQDQAMVSDLMSKLDSALREKTAQQAMFTAKLNALAAENVKNQEKADQLLGSIKVLNYEKETLTADIANKENKITELGAEIAKQRLREENLMALIEEAKKQVRAKV